MHPSWAVGLLAATAPTTVSPAGPGSRYYEVVPVRPDAHDPSWPPVLIFCVAVLVLAALFAAVVFLRRAWAATHPVHGPLDG